MTQTDEIHSGGSDLSQNDVRVHFGLGPSDKIQNVTIYWPSAKSGDSEQPGCRQVLLRSPGAGHRSV
jgi:hypothetical protein